MEFFKNIIDWLNTSFEQNSIFWLILSATLGGLIGHFIPFFINEVLKIQLSKRREVRRIVREYSTPLLKTGLSLERRINNFIRNAEKGWFKNEQYYRMSTLFIFCEFFGWIHILEKKTSFLEYPSTKETKKFKKRLNGVFRATTSFAYFRDLPDIDDQLISASSLPRLTLRALGEIVTKEKNGDLVIMDFTEFTEAYEGQNSKFSWLERLENFLQDIGNETNELKWDRLILLGANLKRFLLFLDEKRVFLRNEEMANLDLLKNELIKKSFLEELRKEKD